MLIAKLLQQTSFMASGAWITLHRANILLLFKVRVNLTTFSFEHNFIDWLIWLRLSGEKTNLNKFFVHNVSEYAN